ncbi:LysR substrate-binding domain-containing protein [Hyphomicrobium sp.]|uniref:LysR substrate-binding domain-containing protein n=1 Tax=Hyphomicrobium sp. TaxID=82 RepID=UPI000FAA5074|nr:LysR substrate-binding domain-containing protein [Hyphomicrobium sp.]RUO99372.1 MAG: LysR family transcriptional regulator [Hyphomicrobium sp.]
MFDPALLQTFLLIAEGNSFSEASRKLGLRQPTVSDHVRKLEELVGRRLFVRDTHTVSLTIEGEAMIEFARNILEANERAKRHFAGAKLRGRLRFGASEDLVSSWLPDVLHGFMRDHPEVDLELTIALSNPLIAKFDAGELDVALCKRWPGDDRGEFIWRDSLVWAGNDEEPNFQNGQLPLIVYPPPSISRYIALGALEQAAVPWRIACTSGSLSGLVAATRAGLGVMAHSRRLMPKGLHECADTRRLPKLGDVEFVLLRPRRGARAPVSELSAAIVERAEQF